ncbi:MAG TPA: hypothetical protein VGS08_03185 [Candidatus Saccharimonadales bacterium]|nr:hypothetical protein [Candidatus Saccharimonadales bacterium]
MVYRANLIAVSLDSIDSDVNERHRGERATEKAVATIAALRRPGREIPFRINATITRSAIGGLYELCDFAQDQGAQTVLVHFPSTVGRGQRWEFSPTLSPRGRLDRVEKSEIPNNYGEWSKVLTIVDSYNRRYTTRHGFRVECEYGYDYLAAAQCYMLERSTSLQFAPQLGLTNPDIPVVACGLNMDTAATESAYILRCGELHQRAGISELQKAQRGIAELALTERRCPLRNGKQPGCIYDRVGGKVLDMMDQD